MFHHSKKRSGSELETLYSNYENQMKFVEKSGKKSQSKLEFEETRSLRKRAFRAARRNAPKTLESFFGKGLDPDTTSDNGTTLLGLVLPKGDSNAEIVDLLLRQGASKCNDMEGDPLWFVPEGNPKVQRLVVEASTNLNIRDFTKATPLICAAKNKDKFFYDLLLQNGADPSARDDFGKTAASYF